ncbi:MAG: 2-hydroxyacyl-CoA dehydratase family protein [Peptococcaceae bacterium]|nr:2-hydroxyacyl-CoA dehydratase family protein [Peptococcaceae bacterium]
MLVSKNVQELCTQFKKIIAQPGPEIQRLKAERQVPLIGYLPIDVPEELIHASGAQPYGLVSYEGMYINRADGHLQTWACSLVRCSFGMALAGKLDYLNGLIIPQICDTTRMISGIWKQTRPYAFMEDFVLPRQVGRPSARNYLIGELGRLKARLEQFTGRPITAEELHRSISLYNKNRTLLRKLYQLHVHHPDLITNLDVFSAIKSSLLIPKDLHNTMVSELISAVEQEALERKAGDDTRRVRVVLSGKIWEPPAVMDILDESGAVCAADDLYTGYRYIAGDVAEKGDPMEALADRQLKRLPSPCFVSREQDRFEYLVNRVKESGAAGVIFLHFKFCETENYDYPLLRDSLLAVGIPNIRVETEIGNVSHGQISTRIQAFVEMLEGGEINGSWPAF